MSPLSVTVDDFCTLIGIKRSMAFGLIRQGEVDVVKISRKTLITMESIERLLQRNLTKGNV